MNIAQAEFNALQNDNFTIAIKEGESRRVSFNWASLLQTDTIASSAWLSQQQGITIDDDGTEGAITGALVSGKQGRYTISNTITTTIGGETFTRTITAIIRPINQPANDYV